MIIWPRNWVCEKYGLFWNQLGSESKRGEAHEEKGIGETMSEIDSGQVKDWCDYPLKANGGVGNRRGSVFGIAAANSVGKVEHKGSHMKSRNWMPLNSGKSHQEADLCEFDGRISWTIFLTEDPSPSTMRMKIDMVWSCLPPMKAFFSVFDSLDINRNQARFFSVRSLYISLHCHNASLELAWMIL